MLLCLPSSTKLYCFYDILGLPKISPSILREKNITVYVYPVEKLFFTVLRSPKYLTVVKQLLITANHAIEKVLCLTIKAAGETVVVTTTEDLAREMNRDFSTDIRNKLSSKIFHEYPLNVERDALMGFNALKRVLEKKSHNVHRRVESEQCVICLMDPPETILNCGHECMCDECATLWLKEGNSCPVCKCKVTDLIKGTV